MKNTLQTIQTVEHTKKLPSYAKELVMNDIGLTEEEAEDAVYNFESLQ